MMGAVSSYGTFVSTYHNGRSVSPEDVKIVFTCPPSRGPKTSCRLLSVCSETKCSDGSACEGGVEKVQADSAGWDMCHGPPRGTEH